MQVFVLVVIKENNGNGRRVECFSDREKFQAAEETAQKEMIYRDDFSIAVDQLDPKGFEQIKGSLADMFCQVIDHTRPLSQMPWGGGD